MHQTSLRDVFYLFHK